MEGGEGAILCPQSYCGNLVLLIRKVPSKDAKSGAENNPHTGEI